MKRRILFNFAILVFCSSVQAAPPAARYSVEGNRATVSWLPVDSSSKYRLYWLPYPMPNPPQTINSIELGTETRVSAVLEDGAMY